MLFVAHCTVLMFGHRCVVIAEISFQLRVRQTITMQLLREAGGGADGGDEPTMARSRWPAACTVGGHRAVDCQLLMVLVDVCCRTGLVAGARDVMGNQLCAPWRKGYREDEHQWTPRKDSHLLRYESVWRLRACSTRALSLRYTAACSKLTFSTNLFHHS